MTKNARTKLASRRNEPVICASCGRKVDRKMRGQRFCSARCRDRGRGRSRKAFLDKNTRAPARSNKISRNYRDLRKAKALSSKSKVGLACVIQIECFDPHYWEERVSPDGVKAWITQLRPRYGYR